jgi:hypothetical protein
MAGPAPLTAQPQAIRIERLTDPSALEQLSTEWSLLATRTEDLSVFQTYEWQRTCLRIRMQWQVRENLA